MGAEQSAESKRKDEERHQRMVKNALEEQRLKYEAKCRELLREQKKIIKAAEEPSNRNAPQDRISFAEPLVESLYPNLQQPSSSSGYNNAQSIYSPTQNKATVLPLQHSTWQPLPYSNVQQNVNVSAVSNASYIPSANNNTVQNKPNLIAFPHMQPFTPTAPTAPTVPEPNANSEQKHGTRTKNKNNIYQCPTCKKNPLEINIFQCQEGHSSCSQCKTNEVKCGICRSSITSTRNIELERIVANLQPQKNVQNMERVNCPNSSDGCRNTCKPSLLADHLKQCIFREMECPATSIKYSQCSWRGKINQMQSHFNEYHTNLTGASVDKEISFHRFQNQYDVHYVAIGNFNFFVHVKMDLTMDKFFMCVQLIGSPVSASKWIYEIHVYDKSEPRRKFMYMDVCLPISIPFMELSKDSRCAALPLQYALSFFKDEKVTYKFYIKRDESKVRQKQNRAQANRPET